MGVEPTLSAWEAGVLPMNYIREYWQYTTGPQKIQVWICAFFRPIFFRRRAMLSVPGAG